MHNFLACSPEVPVMGIALIARGMDEGSDKNVGQVNKREKHKIS